MENKEEIGKASFGSVVKAKYVPKNRTVVGKIFFGEGKAVNKTRIGSDRTGIFAFGTEKLF